MKYILLAICTCYLLFPSAQTTQGLAAWYNFEECPYTTSNTIRDVSGSNSNGQAAGVPACSCGVDGQAMAMDGIDDEAIFIGSVNNQFNKKDFSVSVYIKPLDFTEVQSIMSKRESCSEDNAFSITFNPQLNTINVLLSENSSKHANVFATLDIDKCWHHIVFVRSGNRSQLYVNGVLRQEKSAISRVDILNNAAFWVGNSACNVGSQRRFRGVLDELRVYDKALSRKDVEELYIAPDQIITRDTTIFLGADVNIRLNSGCASDFDWFPVVGVNDPQIAQPTITPTQTTTYKVQLTGQENCIAFDTIRITVIDPASLDCKEVYLPKAFTPNGDNLNDHYGISNPFAVQKLHAFEIFDRWGGRVFFTDDPFITWDGSFKGEPLNPGVLLYRVRFSCEGEESVAVGSLSLIR